MGLSLQSSEWKRLRLEILQRDGGQCSYCGDIATEIDHIFPRSRGGSDEPENLAASCRRCNNAKGGKVNKPVFLSAPATPPDLISVNLPEKPTKLANDYESQQNGHTNETELIEPVSKTLGAGLIGSPTPRVFSSPVEGATSRAPEVIAFAESIGYKLMPWQINALHDMLLVKDGKFIGKTVALCVSRQNGKTELAKLRILAGIYLFGEKSIGMMSSNRNMAVNTFRQIHYLIQDTPALLELWEKTYSTNGNERIRFKNGAEIMVIAATSEGARGYSFSFIFIDELRDIKPEAWDAALYTTQAKPESQILCVSNAGDKSSTVLNSLRDKGLEDKTPSLRWLEWSAHPSLKITDPKAWAQANPALGHTITAEILEHRILTGEPNQVRTEMLTQWVQNLASPWPINAWMDNKVENMVFEPGASTFFAMDISPSRRHAALVAGQLNGEKVKLKCLQTWNAQSSIDDLRMASEINEHIKRFKPKMLLFDRYTSAGVAARLAHTGVLVTEISGQLFASACDEMLAAMSHNRIEHADQYELSESVNSCAMRTTDSGWRIVRRKSAGGEVAAAIASAMVIWYANKPQAVAAIYVN